MNLADQNEGGMNIYPQSISNLEMRGAIKNYMDDPDFRDLVNETDIAVNAAAQKILMGEQLDNITFENEMNNIQYRPVKGNDPEFMKTIKDLKLDKDQNYGLNKGLDKKEVAFEVLKMTLAKYYVLARKYEELTGDSNIPGLDEPINEESVATSSTESDSYNNLPSKIISVLRDCIYVYREISKELQKSIIKPEGRLPILN